MDVLYTLIPLSIALVFVVIAVLCWAVFSGQFDDIEAQGARILEDEEGNACPAALTPGLDLDQRRHRLTRRSSS
jgi:cbb3-type cytochrome oxidase maturation protein